MALVEGCKHALELTVPAAEVAKETERVATKFQGRVRLPGFRPGKAPMNIVKQRFSAEIRQDVVESVIPKALQKKFEEDHLQVVGQPTITDLHFHDGDEMHIKVEFEVAPEFELKEYRNLEVGYNEPVVADADVDARVNELREQKAEYVNEDPRPAVDGDYCVVSVVSFEGVEGAPVKSDDLMLKIGDEATMPPFSEALRGMSPGDEKDVTVEYPADYAHEQLAGKKVSFHMSLKVIRRKELPELNDEFAKDLGDYQTLDDLKQAVKTDIFRQREFQAQEKSKNDLVEKLVDGHEFPVPNAYVDRQIEVDVENSMRSLAQQGIDPSQIKLDWDKVRESRRDRATREVRATLLLDKIATVEAIDTTNEEIDRQVHNAARQTREPAAAVRQKWEKDGTLRRIASQIRTSKTLNFLFENARKVAVAEEPEAGASTEKAPESQEG